MADRRAHADGSYLGFLQARRNYTAEQIQVIKDTDRTVVAGVQMIMAMVIAWDCRDEYSDWCVDSIRALSALRSPTD